MRNAVPYTTYPSYLPYEASRRNHSFLATWLGAILVFAVIVAYSVISPGGPALKGVPKASSTVYIAIGDSGHCSGVYLGNGLVLTAAHCEGDGAALIIKTDKGTEAPATRLWVGQGSDFMLLSTELKGIAASPLACRKPIVGEDIHISGHPLDQNWITTWGRVAGEERIHAGILVVPMDATALWGNSGGPVFDADGYVIGLLDQGLLGPVVAAGGKVPNVGVATGITFMAPSYVACRLMGEGRKV